MIPDGLILGGQGRRGTECLKSAYVMCGSALLAALILVASFPSGAHPVVSAAGCVLSLRDAAPPRMSQDARGAAAFWE